jgi:hypothetical protein
VCYLPAESVPFVVLRYKVESNRRCFPSGKTIDIGQYGYLAVRVECCVYREFVLARLSLFALSH